MAQSQWDIQFKQSSLDCSAQQVCYQLEVQNTAGNTWSIGDQNYRFFFDGDNMTVISITSLLPNDFYGNANIDQNIKISGQGQEAASPLDDIDDNLGFLDFSIVQTDKSNPSAATQISTDNFIPIAEICVEVTDNVINSNSSTNCLAFYHSRASTAGEITSQFTVISENDAPNSTITTMGVNYNDLTSDDGSDSCLASTCVSDSLDLALTKKLADPTLTTIAIGNDIEYEICVINEGNVSVDSVTIEDILPEETILSLNDNNGWNIQPNGLATTVVVEPLAPGQAICTPIVLTIVGGNPNDVLFNVAQIIEVHHTNVGVQLDIDSTPNEDNIINEDDEDQVGITLVSADCPTITFADNSILCSGETVQLSPIFDIAPQGNFSWSPSNTLNNPMAQNPIATPSITTTYTLTYTGVGCNIETSITVQIDDESPLITGVPIGLTLPCGATIPEVANPTVSDNFDGNIMPLFVETIDNNNCNQQLTRTWTATDNCGNTTVSTQVILFEDNTTPTISGIPDDTTVDCANIPNPTTPIVEDDCDNMIDIIYNEAQNGSGCSYELERTWMATDDCGNTTIKTQRIFVTDNIAPIFLDNPADVNVSCGVLVPTAINPTVSDNCDAGILALMSEEVITNDCGYRIERTWTATDNCGNASSIQQTVFVSEAGFPIFSNTPADITIECTEPMPDALVITAQNECNNESITVAFEENINNQDCEQIIKRTWSAIDDCGNMGNVEQFITIIDVTPPIISNLPNNVSTTCTIIPNADTPAVNDDCSENVNLQLSEEQVGSGCTYDLIRTWTATDECGNSSTASQTIHVNDNTPPVFEFNHPLLININSGDTLIQQCGATDIFSVNDAIIFDDCDNNPILTLNEGNILVSTCDQNDYLVWMECYWEATDACGNSSQFWIYIKVVDSTPPVINNVPSDLTVDEVLGQTIPNPPTIFATDNCESNPEINYNQEVNQQNCERILTRTWIAMDNCGNQTTASQTITVLEDCPFPTDNPLIVTELTAEKDRWKEPKINCLDNYPTYYLPIPIEDVNQYEIKVNQIIIEPSEIISQVSSKETLIQLPIYATTFNIQIRRKQGGVTKEINVKNHCIELVEQAKEENRNSIQSDIVIYNGFSPNHDGINDFFTIKGIEKIEAYEILIFDKWGKKVFKTNHYQNDWDGTYHHSALPEDVYFYVLLLNGERFKTGFLQISY